AEERGAGLRYDAACSAALAGCGRVEDGAELGDTERVHWRTQSRAWLRAELDAWGTKLQSSFAVDRAQGHENPARWRKDPDLAGLRDPEALEILPPAERQECRTLWRDHDDLLQRAGSSK